MSGGHFDYQQYRLEQIADEIGQLIYGNDVEDEWGYKAGFSPQTLDKLMETIHWLKRTAEMVQRVDWLVSGDDGEDAFHERWKTEVRKP